ncbi:hypothetical protein JI739_07540 [Ramlibacter sp. AW1]|uniref:Stereocilin n=1 Tax=Ramlibacter aurantiacus TaxID=2801330 RepID=A0A936ZMU5_9BURK|nr:hypothetical protein [Ramlibacter aurantiacus]MBL0420198.1 hypothetical protein [Ramlibacter aurantiacus]
MATHPVEPDHTPDTGAEEPADQPNTTRLPVEPEFLPDLVPGDPEDPGAKPLQP